MVSLWQSGQFVGAGSLIPAYEFRDWTQGLGLGSQHLYLWSQPEESRDNMFLLCVYCRETLFFASGPHCQKSSFLRLSSLQCWDWTRVLDIPDNCSTQSNVPSLPFSSDEDIWAVNLKVVKSRYMAFLWPGSFRLFPCEIVCGNLDSIGLLGGGRRFLYYPYCCFVFPTQVSNLSESKRGQHREQNLFQFDVSLPWIKMLQLTLLSEQLTSLIRMAKG